MSSITAATQAYANIAKLSDPSAALAKGLGGALGATKSDGENFGALLKGVVGSIQETAKKSDAQAQAMATGKANVVDVVTAVAETEVAIDALVAVRDRVIQAYEEIMRMPI
jgi:flagellar hook-basal body complex protein FliE